MLYGEQSMKCNVLNRLLVTTGLCFVSAVMLTGCGESRLPCVKIGCKLLVDGKPYGPATVTLYRQGAKPNERATIGNIERNGEGKLSTYQLGDGIPEGDYSVTIAAGGLGKTPIAKMYSDQSKSPVKITVFKNSDVVKIDLEPIKANSKDSSPLERLGSKSLEETMGEAMQPRN